LTIHRFLTPFLCPSLAVSRAFKFRSENGYLLAFHFSFNGTVMIPTGSQLQVLV